MNICVICGARNEDDARFCTLCGRKMTPRATGHDFTTGVMRYVPDTAPEESAPLYLKEQAVTPHQQTPPAAQPQRIQSATLYQREPVRPAERRRFGKPVFVLLIVLISLVALIVIGIAVLLNGFF